MPPSPASAAKPGELLVTARFVRVGDREIRLRSFSLGAKGRDRSDDSLGAQHRGWDRSLMFVVGGAMIIPRGTVAWRQDRRTDCSCRPWQPAVDST